MAQQSKTSQFDRHDQMPSATAGRTAQPEIKWMLHLNMHGYFNYYSLGF